ncbi:hypothetical protein ABK040_000253 [Willaertia magna]
MDVKEEPTTNANNDTNAEQANFVLAPQQTTEQLQKNTVNDQALVLDVKPSISSSLNSTSNNEVDSLVSARGGNDTAFAHTTSSSTVSASDYDVLHNNDKLIKEENHHQGLMGTTNNQVHHPEEMVDDLDYYLNSNHPPVNQAPIRSVFLTTEEEEEAAMHPPMAHAAFIQQMPTVTSDEEGFLVKTTLRSDYEEELLKTEHDYYPSDIIQNFAIILHRLPLKTVKHIATKNNLAVIDPTLKKGKKVTDDHRKEYWIFEICKKVVIVGVKHFFTELDREDMRSSLNDLLKVDHASEILMEHTKKDIDNEFLLNAKTVHTLKKSGLRYNFKLLFEKMGAEEFLDSLNDKTLVLFLQALEINEFDTTHPNLVDAILEEVFLYGAKEVLCKCKKTILKEAAEASNYDGRHQVFEASPTKEMLAEVVLVDEFPHVAEDLILKLKKKKPYLFDAEQKSPKKHKQREKEKEKENESEEEDDFNGGTSSDVGSPGGKGNKKRGRKRVINTDGERPPIEKGVSFNDLKDKYLVQELISFAQSKGLKYVGVKKADLCASIIKYLNGELAPTVKKQGRGRPPKKKKNDDDENDDMEE